MSFLLCRLDQNRSPAGSVTPTFSPALKRPLSWDRYGAYPLDVEGPLPQADQRIVEAIQAGELGVAEALARNRIEQDGQDPLPAWVLGQIFRVKKAGRDEYRRRVQGKVEAPASPAVLLYRIQVCRIAQREVMLATHSKDQSAIVRLDREMASLCERCAPYAKKSLGMAIGITLVPSADILHNRRLWEAFCQAHPSGVDGRPMLCQTYNIGAIYGKPAVYTYPDGRSVVLHRQDEPEPEKALAIARSILKDRPQDALGHFYAGRSYVVMKKTNPAMDEFRKALATGKLPHIYEDVARRYLENPSPRVFSPDVPY